MQEKTESLTKKKRTRIDDSAPRAFYDLKKLNEIPILAVCDHLNIPIEKHHGQKAWCKIRNERTPSVVLDLEKNTFHDFGGGGCGGDVIALYAYAAGVSQGEAICALAQAFGVPPENLRDGLGKNDLTDYEWQAIGIFGPRAAQNFSLDGMRMPIERLWEISERYSMPMNQLRREHPKTYERLLKQKALPYVRSLRTDYYLQVYGQYRLCRSLGDTGLFSSDSIQKELKQPSLELSHAERILTRAIHDTSLSYTCCKSYEPGVILKQLLHGDLLGSLTYKGMQSLAKKRGCKVEYRSMGYTDYALSGLTELQHTAFLRGDQVIIGFLSTDKEKVQEVLNPLRSSPPDKCSSESICGRSEKRMTLPER